MSTASGIAIRIGGVGGILRRLRQTPFATHHRAGSRAMSTTSTLTAGYRFFHGPLRNRRGSDPSHDREGVVARNETLSHGHGNRGIAIRIGGILRRHLRRTPQPPGAAR